MTLTYLIIAVLVVALFLGVVNYVAEIPPRPRLFVNIVLVGILAIVLVVWLLGATGVRHAL